MNNLSRRTFLKVLSTIATIPLFSQCLPNLKPLAIASHVWSGYEFMFLARREGWLSPDSIKFIETLSATDSIHALISGKADGAALTLDEVLRVRSQGIPLICVLVFDVSAGADMVLSKTELSNLTELAGKRIGFESSALGELMLYELLEEAQLKKTDIIPIKVNYDQHLTAWQQNKIDTVITFEPIASQLLNQGAYKLFDSRKIPDTIFDVLAVKPNMMSSHTTNIGNLVAAHFRARQYFYRNPQDAAYKMAIRMKLSASEVLDSFRGLNLPNEQANQKYLSPQNSTLIKAAKTLSSVMIENGIIKQPDNLAKLVNAAFLPKTP